MRKLAKIAAPALAAIAALGTMTPASAQSWAGQYERGYEDNHRGDWRGSRDDYGPARAIRGQIDRLQRMVEHRDGRDRISEREAAGLRRAVWDLRSDFRAMNRDGLSRWETRQLQTRIERIRDRLAHESHDRDGRGW